MARIDEDWLSEVGLSGLPQDFTNRLIGHLTEHLESRVGNRLGRRLTSEQLEEFSTLIRSGDQGAAIVWLDENAPGHQLIVASEEAKLKIQVRRAAETLISASKE